MTKQPVTVRIKLVRSTIGRLAAHKACVRGLGLSRMHQVVEVIDTPEAIRSPPSTSP